MRDLVLLCAYPPPLLPLSFPLCANLTARSYLHSASLSTGLSIFPHPVQFSLCSISYIHRKRLISPISSECVSAFYRRPSLVDVVSVARPALSRRFSTVSALAVSVKFSLPVGRLLVPRLAFRHPLLLRAVSFRLSSASFNVTLFLSHPSLTSILSPARFCHPPSPVQLHPD